MEELQKLYDVLVREGKYTKSFDEFQNKWKSDQAYQNKVYGVVKRDGLYTKDINSFLQKYSFSEPKVPQTEESSEVKKKVSSELQKPQAPKADTMESSSEDGSLVSQEPPKKKAKVAEEVGVLDDLWNTFKGSGAKALSTIAAIPEFAQNAAMDIVLSASGESEEFNKLPSSVKKQIKNNLSKTGIGGPITSVAASAEASDYLNKKSEEIYKKTRQEQVDVVDELSKFKDNPNAESIQKILYQGLKTTVESIPYMAIGAVSLPFMGAAAAAGKRKEDIEETGDIGIANLINAGVYGTAEAIFEGTTQKILGKAAKSAIGKPDAAKAVAEGFVKSVLKDFGEEAFSEGATTLIQDVSDKITKGEDVDFYKLAKDVANSAILGGLSGGGISATGASIGVSRRYIAGKLASKEQVEKIKGNTKTIQSLNVEKGEDVDPKINEIVDKKIEELAKENKSIVETNEEIALNLSDDQVKRIIEIDNKLEDNYKSAKSIIDNPAMDDKAKGLLLDDLLKEQNSLKEEKENIKNQVSSQLQTTKPETDAIQKQATELPEEIANLNDNELVTFTVKTLDEVPEQFRDKAEKIGGQDVETRKLILGLPLGKKETVKVPEAYVYSLTGKEAKDYAIQKQSTDEGVLRPEQPEVELQGMGEGNAQPIQATEETITPTQPEEVKEPEVKTEEAPVVEDVVKVKKSPDFMNDAEHIVDLNGEEVGRMYYDRSSKSWRDPNFDRSKYSPESFERIYGDILGDTKQEATDELIRRRKESMKKEIPVDETVVEETAAEELQGVEFTKDTVLNKFLNKLNSLNPLQKNPIDNKSFIYGDKASLEFNRFDKGDKNEVSLEGISSFDKGRGLGKEVMVDITKSADELGTTLILDAKPFGREGLGKKELIDFYKKNGFEVDQQYLEDLDFDSEQEAIDYVLENESEALPMIRKPQAEVTFIEKSPIEIQESRVKSAQSLLDEAKTKAAKKKAMTDLVAEQERLAEMKALEKVKAETTPAEVDKIKSDIDASKERLKKAWDKYKTVGIIFDPKSNLAKDRELVKALVEYAYNNIRLGSYTASKLIEDLAKDGFGITRDGAKFIMDRASRKVQKEIDKNIGVKPRPTEQKRINKAYSIGVATQKVATEEAKAEIKDLKAQVVDVFKAGIEAVRLSDAEAKEKTRAQKQIADELTKKIKDLASTGRITVKQAANIIRAFGKVDLLNKESVDNFTDYMSNVFEKAEKSQVEQQKEQVLSKMMKLVSNKAKTAITQTGKRRTSGLDAQGQSFFVAVKEVLKAFTKNDQDAINKLTDRLSDQNAIDEAISKELRGEPLTTEENMLLNRVLAFDLFSDISNKSYEEIKSLYDGLVEARALSIQNLKKNRLDRAAQLDTLRNKADNQVKNDFGILFNSDGTLKTANQLRQEKEKIFQNFRELKIWEGVKGFVKAIDITTVTGIKDYFRNRLSHIGTLTNLLDKSGTFFTDNIYRPLNQMEEKYLKGYYEQTDKLDEIASSIKGIKSYRDITKKLYSGVKKITINGKENLFSADQLLRIYALSKNDIQRKKLESMGIDNNVLDKIKKELDPSVIEFADKIVDYFSNEYFESVNKVYSKMNDVNLGYVENYFPTKTLQKGVSGKLLEDGDFNGIFNAETAPALKERTDVSGEIDLSPAFTDVLDNHFQTVERYKAYAEGVRKLNQIFSLQSVNTLINEVGIKDILKRSVNLSINPSSGLKERQTFIGRAMNKFTSFALAFKIWQIPKQATSFINAYEDYQFLKGKKTPGLDLLMFMIDSAYVIATLPKQIKTATDMSASFRDRLNKGIVGDSYTMEAGSRLFRPVDKSSSLISKIRRGFKLAGAAPTIIGDIIGVMGYMVNHRRNVINNMDPELALEKFNDYNATAQTRRGTEKIALQQSQNDLTRAFTMFGSTTFLMINKVASAQTNIMRSLGKGEMPNQKDIRSMVLMLGLSNAMFVLTSNIGKLIAGDDDDKEEVKNSMFEAMVGLDLIFSVPLIGAGLETAYRKAMGEKARVKEGVNPYIQVFNKIKKGLDSKEYMGEVRPIIEFVLGAQLDPAIGLYNYFYSEKEDPEAIYDILGIAPSYRPKTQEEQEKSKKEKQAEEEKIKALREVIKESDDRNVEAAAREMIKEMKETDPDKLEKMKEERKRMKEMKESLLIDEQTGVEYDSPSDMKKYNKDLWEKNFGEGSQWYKENGAEAEAKRMMNKIRTKEEEEEFGYTPKKKRKSRFSLGRYRS